MATTTPAKKAKPAPPSAASSAYGLLSRLRDPDGLMSPDFLALLADHKDEALRKLAAARPSLQDLDRKISDCMTFMCRTPEHGGNPFLFTIAVSKQHIVAADEEMAAVYEKVYGRRPCLVLPCATAATDGRHFYWHPAFLSPLNRDEVPTVMEHEVYHVLFEHMKRMLRALRRQSGWAVDYVVNSCIEKNRQLTHQKGQLWGGNLGKPISLKHLLEHIDGTADHFPSASLKTGQAKGEFRIFADVTLYGRTPESIYDEIMEHWEKSPRKCGECGALSLDPKTKKPVPPGPCKSRPACKHKGLCCPACGVACDPSGVGVGDGMPMPMDGHLESAVSKAEVADQLLNAAATVRSMRGTVPAEIESIIAQLSQPIVMFKDVLFSDCMRKSQQAGMKNDWSRPRKRYLAIKPRQYLAKRHGHKRRLLFLLDTSGSMSEADMAYVVSQLTDLVAKGVEVIIVPVDAKPHWDKATHVRNVRDLRATKVAGRGGTVFEDFFRDFPKYVGTDFDSIGIGTDGDCGEIPVKLRPSIPVNWILTKHREGWKPSFGRTLPCRDPRL